MWWSRWPVLHRVLVNLLDGQAFDAVLLRRAGPLLVLGDASLLQPGAEPVRLDGQVYVERAQVAFIQARG